MYKYKMNTVCYQGWILEFLNREFCNFQEYGAWKNQYIYHIKVLKKELQCQQSSFYQNAKLQSPVIFLNTRQLKKNYL